MKNYIIIGLALLIGASCQSKSPKVQPTPVEPTTSQESTQKQPTLEELINSSETFLVDVRTPEEVASGGVAGATNIPLDQVAKQLEQFKGKKNSVVFCRSGARSSQAKAILEQNGFNNVVNGGTWEQVKGLKK